VSVLALHEYVGTRAVFCDLGRFYSDETGAKPAARLWTMGFTFEYKKRGHGMMAQLCNKTKQKME
jgi:hypothetical protein